MCGDRSPREREFDTRADYEIRVRGTIGAGWSDWFGGLSIAIEGDNETVLRGSVEDQPALYGVLAKICELGLPLISVVRHTGEQKESGSG